MESLENVALSSESHQLTSDELFVVRKAIEKLVKPYVKDAESELKSDMQRRYETDGTKTRVLRFGGVEVGSVSARKSKPSVKAVFGHEHELLDYLQQIGLVEVRPMKGWESRFSYSDGAVIDNETGEVCSFLEQSQPSITWAVTGCDPKDVLPLMSLESPIKGILGE